MILLIVGMLIAPWVAGLLGARPETVENRALVPFPELSGEAALDASFFSDLDAFLLDHTPLRQELAAAYTYTQWRASGASPATDVFIGSDGTLFLSQDFLFACEFDYDPEIVTDRVTAWNDLGSANGTEVVLTIAPDKAPIRDDLYSFRMGLARHCADERREGWQAGMFASAAHLPMWDTLRDAQRRADESLYFRYDSHWTYEGARVFARTLVDRFAPDSWSDADVVPRDRHDVKADIARRLGWLRIETRDRLASAPPGVETVATTADVGGTRTIRTYESVSTSTSLVPGRTVILHDSMMNFAELMIAPYFESVSFVHWDDIGAADFYGLVAGADRVIIEVVERSSHVRAAGFFSDPAVDERMRSALTAPD